MQRPRLTIPKRPRSSAGRVVKSRKAASIQLVRLEFDLGRLELSIAQARARIARDSAELAEKNRLRMALLAELNK